MQSNFCHGCRWSRLLSAAAMLETDLSALTSPPILKPCKRYNKTNSPQPLLDWRSLSLPDTLLKLLTRLFPACASFGVSNGLGFREAQATLSVRSEVLTKGPTG